MKSCIVSRNLLHPVLNVGDDLQAVLKTTAATLASVTQAAVMLFCASLLLWLAALVW